MDRARVTWNGTSLSDFSQILGGDVYDFHAQPARNLFGGPTAVFDVDHVVAPPIGQEPVLKHNSYVEYMTDRNQQYMKKEIRDATFPKTHEDDKIWVQAIIYNMSNMQGVVDGTKTLTAWNNLMNKRPERLEAVAWDLLRQAKIYHNLGGRLDPTNPDTSKASKLESFAEHLNYMLKQIKTTKTVCKSLCSFMSLNTFVDGPEVVMNRTLSNRRVNNNKKTKTMIGAAATQKVNEMGVDIGDEDEVTRLANVNKQRRRRAATAVKKSPTPKSTPKMKTRRAYTKPTSRGVFSTGRRRGNIDLAWLGAHADLIDDRRSGPLLSPSNFPDEVDTPTRSRNSDGVDIPGLRRNATRKNAIDIPCLRRNSTRKSAKAAAAKVRNVLAKEDKSDDDFDDILGEDILSVRSVSEGAEGEDDLLDAARVQYGDAEISHGATAKDVASTFLNATHEAATTNTDVYGTERHFGPDFAIPFYKGDFSHSTKGMLEGGSSKSFTDDFNQGNYQYPKYTTTASTQIPPLETGLNPAESPSRSGWTRMDKQQMYPTGNTLESYGDFGAGYATFDHLGGQDDYYNSQPSTTISEHFPNYGLHESQPSTAISEHFPNYGLHASQPPSATTEQFPADTYNDPQTWGLPDYNDPLSWGFLDQGLDLPDVRPIPGQDPTGYDGSGMGDSTGYRFN